MDQYISIFNRLTENVEHRCRMTGQAPSPADIVIQLSLRGRVMKKSTVNVEIAAVKKVIGLADFENGQAFWPDGIVMPVWLSHMTDQQRDQLRTNATLPYLQIREGFNDEVQNCLLDARKNGHDLLEAELMDAMAGKKKENKSRIQKDQRYLRWRDLMALEAELSSFDPVESLESLRTSGEVKSSLEGTLRLFINTIWFTGMRPQEIWNCILLAPRTDIDFTQEMIDRVRHNPYQAAEDGLLVTVESVFAQIGGSLGTAARTAMQKSGAPCILLIPSVKTTNQRKELKKDMRLQVLEHIPQLQLNMIALATQTRRLGLEQNRKNNIRSSLNRLLVEVKNKIPSLCDLSISLYSFRHSFVTRAKMALPPNEVAALTGHTSRNSIYHYGQRNRGRGRGHEKNNTNLPWLPAADPTTSARILSVWERDTPKAQGPVPK